ncbi:glycine cleavage system aminomethyltransferase GcvT [Aliamphritea hakodatensis]|uniref:glycine cleavage system aminomethyltransferase GcvT n=1 Tax=Aliamphritea hakodatensis TaxID=2895352 RepID=UPI0022FD81A6|nr:glycine cleavage system aminomethyltransferase GcvT [Aliamphritea hakodatensis]
MSELHKTALYDLHLELGAKMVPFAGYDMPVQYPLGVKKEHLHCRDNAGLFDVSHMGQVKLVGQNAAAVLEKLVPVDIIDLPVGKQRYALFTNEEGGIMDDLMVANYGDHLYLVVNAACKEQDIAHLQANLSDGVTLEIMENRSLVALQGLKAAEALGRICPEVHDLVFMDSRALTIDGVDCLISRSGYTGEDGYEISIPSDQAEALVRRILAEPEVEPIGLGARDSLRLESGLCLYGHDLDQTTTPVEGSLLWAISKCRRADGERAGGFPGADIIFEQIATKNISRKRVGMIAQGKAPIREGADITDAEGNKIGVVTSGSFGPTLGVPITMGYVATAHAALGTEVYANVRGKALPMVVSKAPFIEQRYYRG